MVRHDIEIARRIGILIIDGRRNPLPIQRKCAKRRFDRAGRAERMRVIALGSAHGNALRVIAEHLFDRRRFRAVVELRRAGVGVDVIDLLRRQLRVGQRFAHRANARLAARQRRGHVEGVVVQAVAEHLRVDVCAPRCARVRVPRSRARPRLRP